MGVNAGDGKNPLLPDYESEQKKEEPLHDVHLHGRRELTLE